MTPAQREGQKSGVLYEISALVLNLLKTHPAPVVFSGGDSFVDRPMPAAAAAALSSPRRQPPPPQQQISPAGFASLLLGVSLTLMMCGSLTFFIGFMLMPWVLGLVMVFYLAGIVSTLSFLGRSILGYYAAAPPDHSERMPSSKLFT